MNQALKEAIVQFVEKDPGNRPGSLGGIRMYSEPLVGFAKASDPFFQKLREGDTGIPDHRAPVEWLPGAKTVISYFLPFTEEIRSSNRAEGLPSPEWSAGRVDGELFNDTVRRYLVGYLKDLGARAVAPMLSGDFVEETLRSNWSEKHVAYIAGLGSFGLSRSLITPKGSAGRLGSVVTDLELELSHRSDGPYYQNCPWLVKGECGDCISRCPSGAITEKGTDTAVCARYQEDVIIPRFHPSDGCGKCQTKVACEAGIP